MAEDGACTAEYGACATEYGACATEYCVCAAEYGACATEYGACAAESGTCATDSAASGAAESAVSAILPICQLFQSLVNSLPEGPAAVGVALKIRRTPAGGAGRVEPSTNSADS